MTDQAWPAFLSQHAAKVLAELPPQAQEMTRDVLDIASRAPWGWPQWDPTDPDGEDVRMASVGPLTAVYWVNRARARINVLDVSWLG